MRKPGHGRRTTGRRPAPTWLAALDKAEAEASKLQTVAADGLEDAKVSYDKATTELSDAWGKVRPEDRADKASGD